MHSLAHTCRCHFHKEPIQTNLLYRLEIATMVQLTQMKAMMKLQLNTLPMQQSTICNQFCFALHWTAIFYQWKFCVSGMNEHGGGASSFFNVLIIQTTLTQFLRWVWKLTSHHAWKYDSTINYARTYAGCHHIVCAITIAFGQYDWYYISIQICCNWDSLFYKHRNECIHCNSDARGCFFDACFLVEFNDVSDIIDVPNSNSCTVQWIKIMLIH